MMHRTNVGPEAGSRQARRTLAVAALLAVAAFVGAACSSADSGSRFAGRAPLDESVHDAHTRPRSANDADAGASGADRAGGGLRAETEPVNAEPVQPEGRPAAALRDSLTDAEMSRIEGLVDMIGYAQTDDEDERDILRRAENELVDMGPRVVPHLRRMATGSRALRIVALIVRIEDEYPDADFEALEATYQRRRSGDAAVGDAAERTADESSDAVDRGRQDAGSSRGDAPPRTTRADRMALLRDLLDDDALVGTGIDMPAVSQFMLVKMREMERAAARLNYDRAIELGEAILTLAPQMRFRQEVRGLIDRYRDRQLQMGLLNGRVACLEPEVLYGESIPFRISLQNVSDTPLEISFTQRVPRSRARSDEYDSPIQLEIGLSQSAGQGMRVSRSESVLLVADGSVRLAPGEVWSKEWTLDTTTLGPELDAIGTVEVRAMIRPLRVVSDSGDEPARQIRCEPATARILPAGYRRARANPVQELERALNQRDPLQVTIAAVSVRDADEAVRWRVIGMLLDRLGNTAGRDMRVAIFNALRAITEFSLANDERHWRAWYESNRPR